MGRLQRMEQRLESWVSDAFARMFRSDVQPVEVASALQRELDLNAKVVSRDRSLAPNTFTVQLSPRDHERLSPYTDSLITELQSMVTEHADLQRYSLPGPVNVMIERADDLHTGQFQVSSEVTPRVAARPEAAVSERSAPAYLEVNDQVIPVRAAGVLVGRGSECDLRINDPGMSRKHAEFRVLGEGPHADVVVVDLHSTNGTIVDGNRMAHALVHDRSEVRLGSTTIVVHRHDPRHSDGPGPHTDTGTG